MTELEEKREKGLALIKEGALAMRSCHECNGAHMHFVEDEDCVIQCFECGRYWLGGIDITIYEEDEKG